jgi:hypothetical protein
MQGLFAWLFVPTTNQFGHCLADTPTRGPKEWVRARAVRYMLGWYPGSKNFAGFSSKSSLQPRPQK